MRLLDLNPLNLGEAGKGTQPGLSSYVNRTWLHGQAAFDHSREDPQSTRFDSWEDLNLDPVSLPGTPRHLADLAAEQLRTLCPDLRRDSWAVCAPGHWDKTQLRLFLGVAGECGMDVRILFPRALALTAELPVDADAWTVWEWQWGRLNLLKLQRDADGWQVAETRRIPDGGVLEFFRREARLISTLSLERHRVDPLYTGTSEQQVFGGWWNHHFHGTAWQFHAGGVQMDFSTEREILRDVHHDWLRQHHFSDSEHLTIPAALKHSLGWERCRSESGDLSGVLKALPEPTAPGARLKTSVLFPES
ncbi:MAG: hypothetical protein WD708_11910 [Kiritimatiellia bacterium]